MVSVVVVVVQNVSLDLAARAIVLQAFLFDEAKIGATKKFALQRQMNRARGGRVLERQRVAEHCGLFMSTSCSIIRFQARTRAPKSGRTLRFIHVNVVFYQSFPSARISKCSHDCQRAPRKLRVHVIVLCASCSHCIVQARVAPAASVQPRQACSRLTSRFRVAFAFSTIVAGAGAVHRQHLSLHV